MFSVNSTSHQFFYDEISDVCYRTLNFLGMHGYCIGDDGSLWSKRKPGFAKTQFDTWKRLKEVREINTGYLSIIRTCGRVYIHDLVMLAFVGPRPTGMWCRHLNDIPTDNRLANLRWGTCKENTEDRERNGHTPRGETAGPSKLTDAIVLAIRKDASGSGTEKERTRGWQRRLARKYNYDRTNIACIVYRKTWTHI